MLKFSIRSPATPRPTPSITRDLHFVIYIPKLVSVPSQRICVNHTFRYSPLNGHCRQILSQSFIGLYHGLLIEYGPICHIVKLPISMMRPFSLVNNSHITLYPQLEIIWKVSKSLRIYWGKYGQISFYIISCITRDCIIVENIFLV